MPKIKITNPRNVIEAPIKKNYFKIRATSGPKGDKGDTGATGPQGPQGPQGNAATIYVGSTTTLPVGQDATVENVGSQYAAVLNFGIPQGPQGPQGAKGDKGDKGDKGEQGNTGNTGPAGQNATVYIGTTTTGAPGSQASVYNSGTENNAVLNFTIPRGQKGDTGATGATGPQGPAGQDGKDFAPSVVDSLPAVGEESKLYLTPKAHTTQTATGNPITATITDGAGQIEDFQLDGDTFQQSYTGKNILPLKNVENGGITSTYNYLTGELVSSGTSTQNYPRLVEKTNITISSGSTVCFSSQETHSHDIIIRFYYDASNYIYTSIDTGNTSSVRAITQDIVAVEVLYYTGTNVAVNESFELMLEIGSSATSFEPFVGGIASPNPTYPQPIQVVTGTQTVAINSTNYPLDLGTIELCKLGTYQDYIYKDGDTWKVHKATARNTGSLVVVGIASTLNSGPNVASYTGAFAMFNVNLSGLATARMSENIGIYQSQTLSGNADANDMIDGTFCQRSGTNDRVYFRNTGFIGKTGAEVRQIMITNSGGIKIAYYLETPTDTEITDTTLISQLNAIASASLENGSNTITNTATGSNLAGDMEVDYFGYDPTNRYDKWLWLDINNAYEKLGS